MRAERGRENDERLGRRLQIVVEAALANQQVDDPRKLRIDGNDLGAIGAAAAGAHVDDRHILRQVRRDGGVPFDQNDVGRVGRVREIEP